jgi:pimeloyl-ACP methyl ester carboxylesterase
MSSVSYIHAAGHRLEYQLLHRAETSASQRHSTRPVLVFLHEGLGSVALWKSFPQQVVEATSCDALVYSRYGYGRSDRLNASRAVDYMHREALETLPQVLKALSIEHPVLIGHSDGGSIALLYASHFPTRGAVVMAPHVFVEDLTVESIAQAKVTFETTNLADKMRRYHEDPEGTFWGWNDIWLDPAFRTWNIEAYLSRIDTPLLLIQGADDQYGTVAQIEAIAKQVCGPVQQLILPNCAHSPHVDQPDATVEAIGGFVAQLRTVKSEG